MCDTHFPLFIEKIQATSIFCADRMKSPQFVLTSCAAVQCAPKIVFRSSFASSIHHYQRPLSVRFERQKNDQEYQHNHQHISIHHNQGPVSVWVEKQKEPEASETARQGYTRVLGFWHCCTLRHHQRFWSSASLKVLDIIIIKRFTSVQKYH